MDTDTTTITPLEQLPELPVQSSDSRVEAPGVAWSRRATRWAWGIVAAGVVFRLVRYAANRSLWLDEAYLAESILTYGARDLATKELLHWQAAPVGFLLLEKLAVTLLGPGEHALRLVPLLAGAASVPLFWAVVRRALPPAGGLVALAMFASVEPLVYYAAEVKQYGVDVAVAVLVLWLALRVAERPGGVGRLAALALCGAAGLFVSHPSVFVLGGAGLMLFGGMVSRGARGPALRLAAVGGAWLALLALNYVAFLRPLTRHAGLDAYWSAAYVPRDASAVPWLGRALHGLFGDYGTMWLPMPDVAALAAVLGVAWLWRRDRRLLGMCVLPVAFALAAAALHRFPFSGRLVLFLVPAVILLVAAGVQATLDATRAGRRLVPGMLVLVLLGPSAGRAIFYAAAPPGREEMKALLAHVRDRKQPGDAVYVFHWSEVPFRYHRDRFGVGPDSFGLADAAVVFGRRVEPTAPALADDLARLRGRGRVWVVLTHTRSLGGPDEGAIVPLILDRWGTRLDEFSAKGARVMLYDLSGRREGQPSGAAP